jgi:hypothetical protein
MNPPYSARDMRSIFEKILQPSQSTRSIEHLNREGHAPCFYTASHPASQKKMLVFPPVIERHEATSEWKTIETIPEVLSATAPYFQKESIDLNACDMLFAVVENGPLLGYLPGIGKLTPERAHFVTLHYSPDTKTATLIDSRCKTADMLYDTSVLQASLTEGLATLGLSLEQFNIEYLAAQTDNTFCGVFTAYFIDQIANHGTTIEEIKPESFPEINIFAVHQRFNRLVNHSNPPNRGAAADEDSPRTVLGAAAISFSPEMPFFNDSIKLSLTTKVQALAVECFSNPKKLVQTVIDRESLKFKNASNQAIRLRDLEPALSPQRLKTLCLDINRQYQYLTTPTQQIPRPQANTETQTGYYIHDPARFNGILEDYFDTNTLIRMGLLKAMLYSAIMYYIETNTGIMDIIASVVTHPNLSDSEKGELQLQINHELPELRKALNLIVKNAIEADMQKDDSIITALIQDTQTTNPDHNNRSEHNMENPNSTPLYTSSGLETPVVSTESSTNNSSSVVTPPVSTESSANTSSSGETPPVSTDSSANNSSSIETPPVSTESSANNSSNVVTPVSVETSTNNSPSVSPAPESSLSPESSRSDLTAEASHVATEPTTPESSVVELDRLRSQQAADSTRIAELEQILATSEETRDELRAGLIRVEEQVGTLQAVVDANAALTTAHAERLAEIRPVYYHTHLIEQKAAQLREADFNDEADAADTLLNRLHEEINTYLNNPSINIADFKNNCRPHITAATQALETHPGWKEILGNLLIGILSLGTAFVLNKAFTGDFLFFNQNDASNKVCDLDAAIEAVTPATVTP